jgi:LETM1 and EF-hand domain-containing protein 1
LNIIKDDKVIDYEGVDTLTIPELQMACLQRGIKTSDASPAKLRDDLETWLDLRLRQKIPSTLLILASAYTYGDKDHSIESYYDALLAVLSSIPDEVYNVAKLELSDDSKLKLDILKEQDELIEEENEREKGTVNRVKDEIKLDDYEETANDGIKVEEDDPEEKKKEEELSKKEEETNEQKEAQQAQEAREEPKKEAKV